MAVRQLLALYRRPTDRRKFKSAVVSATLRGECEEGIAGGEADGVFVGAAARGGHAGQILVDTAAQYHVTPEPLTDTTDAAVRVASWNGQKTTCSKVGEMKVDMATEGGRRVTLRALDTVYMKDAPYTLLAGIKMVDHEWELHCTKKRCWMVTPGGDDVPLVREENLLKVPRVHKRIAVARKVTAPHGPAGRGDASSPQDTFSPQDTVFDKTTTKTKNKTRGGPDGHEDDHGVDSQEDGDGEVGNGEAAGGDAC